MSKISNAMLMLDYLNTGKKFSIKELSELLGVTERMVKYYKEELEYAGIYIESFKGPSGGYFLLKNISPYNKFNRHDIKLLEYANRHLEENNFEFKKEFSVMLEKIKRINKIEEERSKFTSEIEETDKDEKIKYFEKAIQNKERLHIVYKNINGNMKERYIHPLLLFKYEDKFHLVAFCELRNDIRHLSLDHIILKNDNN